MKLEPRQLSPWILLLAAAGLPSLAFAQAQAPKAALALSPSAAGSATSHAPAPGVAPVAQDELPPAPPPPPPPPASGAAAQAAASPEPTPAPGAAPASVPPPSAAPGAADIPPPPAAYADAETCVPDCRSGFVCLHGQCASACNPPCGPGEACASGGECVSRGAGSPSMDLAAAKAAGAEQHDGFFLRLALGVGGAAANMKAAPVSIISTTSPGQYDYSGGAGFFSVDLGAAVIENLIVHARLSDFVIVDPTVKLAGTNLGKATNASLGMGMLGVGASYYFMPLNIYVGGTLGIGQAVFSDSNNHSASSRAGFAIELECGKEWWVSDNWGLGVALRLSHVSVPPANIQPNSPSHLNGTAFGVLFSATYN